MLGKLIKHEWKEISKVGGVILLILVIVTAIGGLMLQMPGMSELLEEGNSANAGYMVFIYLTAIFSFMLYIFMLMGAAYGIFIYLGIRFYKTMYSDRGYLTNTLPATANQLLFSKVLVSGLWFAIVEVAVVASVIAMFASLFSGLFAAELSREGITLWEAAKMIFVEVESVYSEAGLDMVHYLIWLIATLILLPFATQATLFGAITIGQLSKKYKAVMGIVAYIGIGFVQMIISSVIQIVYTVRMTFEIMNNPNMPLSNMNGIMDMNSLLTLIIGVVLYLISHQILTQKLNMD
ncbi:MAG: hypothetical protein E7291_04760 [Lachnospiraceae bacterium]|nr:hypothetical protein [Lachnospiraceae bacterium]